MKTPVPIEQIIKKNDQIVIVLNVKDTETFENVV